jgi:hypothetical protein
LLVNNAVDLSVFAAFVEARNSIYFIIYQ